MTRRILTCLLLAVLPAAVSAGCVSCLKDFDINWALVNMTNKDMLCRTLEDILRCLKREDCGDAMESKIEEVHKLEKENCYGVTQDCKSCAKDLKNSLISPNHLHKEYFCRIAKDFFKCKKEKTCKDAMTSETSKAWKLLHIFGCIKRSPQSCMMTVGMGLPSCLRHVHYDEFTDKRHHVKDPLAMIDIMEREDLINKFCANHKSSLNCIENRAKSCPLLMKYIESFGFSMTNAKFAIGGLCKSTKGIYSELRCLVRNKMAMRHSGLCAMDYYIHVMKNMRSLKNGHISESSSQETCSKLERAILCMAKEVSKCGRMSERIKDGFFAAMTDRCYKKASYQSGFRLKTSSASSLEAAVWWSLAFSMYFLKLVAPF